MKKHVKSTWLDTPLGTMLAISDDERLYLLEFLEQKDSQKKIETLGAKKNFFIVAGGASPLVSIRKEIKHYFAGSLKLFKTPIHLMGTPFQKKVWLELLKIPYGETISYAELARRVGDPKAFRAVANANGANQLAIMIPCHR